METDRRVSLLPDWIIAFGKSSGASTKISPTCGFERAWHFTQERTFLENIFPFYKTPKQRNTCQMSTNHLQEAATFVYHFIYFHSKLYLLQILIYFLVSCLNYKLFNKLLIRESCILHQMLVTLFICMTCMTIVLSTF